MLKKILKNNDGMALALVIMVMTVLIILGTSILSSSQAETKFAVINEKNIQADYIAKSGADIQAQRAFANVESLPSDAVFSIGNGISAGTATVTSTITDGIIKIQSIGRVGDSQKTIYLNLNPLEPIDVFTGIWQTSNESLSFSHLRDFENSENATIVVPPGTTIYNSDGYIFKDVVYTSISLPTIHPPDLDDRSSDLPNITQDGEYGEIGSSSITIAAPDDTIRSVVLSGFHNGGYQGNILVSGGGIVNLYINEDAIFKGSISMPDDASMFIYLDGEISFEFKTHELSENLFIYGPEADFTLDTGQNTLIGGIIAKDVTFSSNATLEYKPVETSVNNAYISFADIVFGYEKRNYAKQ